MKDALIPLIQVGGSKRLRDLGDGALAEVFSPRNVTNALREAFEVYDPVNGGKWLQTLGAGDMVFLDGNAIASSYIVISKSPLHAGTMSAIESLARFSMPLELITGVHISQRFIGQEFSIEVVSDVDVPALAEIAITNISQATTTLTVNTQTPHNLASGQRIGINGSPDSRLNFPSLVVSAVLTPMQFQATGGPMGAITSQTISAVSGGTVYHRLPLGGADNGVSWIYENATSTNASFYVRSDAGDALPSGALTGNHSLTVAGSGSVQAINAPYTYSFQPTNEIRLISQPDRYQWLDVLVDSNNQTTMRHQRTQVTPNPGSKYKLRFRANNNKSVPIVTAQIVSISKSGTTTATVVFDRAHGLATTDQIVAFGVRDQTNFANLVTNTQVLSVVNPTTITITWGAAVTATSYGGYVAKSQAQNALPGSVAASVQSASVVGGFLFLIGNVSWPTLLNGDTCNVVGLRDIATGASLGVDGVYRVRNISTVSLELERLDVPGAMTNFGSVNCGGGVIKRSDMRISFARVFGYDRERVEFAPRGNGDVGSSVNVAVQNTPVFTVSGTNATVIDGVFPTPVGVGWRAANANPTAMSATGDIVGPLATMIGATVVKPYCLPEAEWNFTSALTTTSDVVVRASAGAGVKNHTTCIQATNTGASAVDLIVKDGAAVRLQITIPAGAAVYMPLPSGLTLTAATALNVALSAAGTVRVNMLGYSAP